MANSYFEYVLSQCRTQGISNICEVFSTRKELSDRAYSKFNGCNSITADWRLLEAIKALLDNHDISHPITLGRDAQDVFSRCRSIAFSDGSISYDRFFDLLTDVNWLQASIQNAKDERVRNVDLLSNPISIRRSLKKYLLSVYNGAVQDSNECVYIEEAIQAKGKIFTGLYPFHYEESKYYAFSDYLPSELKSVLQDKKVSSIKGMTLFFGLTATAALADNIVKGRC